jgi:hypothetical protein
MHRTLYPLVLQTLSDGLRHDVLYGNSGMYRSAVYQVPLPSCLNIVCPLQTRWEAIPYTDLETRSADVINISSHVVLRHIRYVLDSMWYSILVLVGAFAFPEVIELQSEDYSGPEGSLTWSDC